MTFEFEFICKKWSQTLKRLYFGFGDSGHLLFAQKKRRFSISCVRMASKKSTFQRHIVVKCENCRDRLCDRFRKCFKYYWSTPQNSLEEWILAGEIVDIYPSREKTVVRSSFLASVKHSISSIFDAKNDISQENHRLVDI